MNQMRRETLKAGGGATALALALLTGLIKPGDALAATWNKTAFGTKNLADTVKALGGVAAIESPGVLITAPDIAENGAVVPVTAISKIAKTEWVAVLVEKNPNMLAAFFELGEGVEPAIQTRIKMGQSSVVYVLVKADGKCLYAKKDIKVTLGGCGG